MHSIAFGKKMNRVFCSQERAYWSEEGDRALTCSGRWSRVKDAGPWTSDFRTEGQAFGGQAETSSPRGARGYRGTRGLLLLAGKERFQGNLRHVTAEVTQEMEQVRIRTPVLTWTNMEWRAPPLSISRSPRKPNTCRGLRLPKNEAWRYTRCSVTASVLKASLPLGCRSQNFVLPAQRKALHFLLLG